MIRKKI